MATLHHFRNSLSARTTYALKCDLSSADPYLLLCLSARGFPENRRQTSTYRLLSLV